MPQIDIFDELAEQIELRIRSSSDNVHGADWIESKRHRDYDLWYVTAGSVLVRTPDGDIRAEAGDAVFFYPNFPYTAWAGEEGSAFIYIHFDFGVGQQFRILEDFPFSGVISGELIEEEGRLLREAYASAKRRSRMSRVRLKGAFLILLAKIIECYGEGHYAGTFRATQGYGGQVADVVTLQPTFEFIHANLHRPIRVPEMAAVASMSEKYFITFFKRAMGATPGQYVQRLRMQRARDILLRQAVPVKAAAARVGYPDAYSFSKAFKKHYGIAPSRIHEREPT